MIESGAGGRARAAGEQGDLAEVAAPRQIGQHQFASKLLFGDFHEPDADQIEAVGGIALAADYLSRAEAQQFHPVAQVIDKILGQGSENGYAAQVRIEGADAIVALQLSPESLVALQDVEHVAQ